MLKNKKNRNNMKKIPFAESKKSGLITLCPQKVENTIHNLPSEDRV